MWRAAVLALFACAGCNQVFGLGQTVAVDAPVIPGGSCGSDMTCSGAEVCDTATMLCAQCTAADASACKDGTPVCGADDVCHACVAHSDCPSDVCLPDGSCGEAAAIAYVSSTGVDPAGAAACDQIAPCATLAKALAAGKPTIKVNGSINGSTQIGSGASVTIVGDDDAELHGTGGATIAVGGDATVTLRDLAISNGSPGLRISDPDSTANVSILHSVISQNTTTGIEVSAIGGHPSLTVAQSRIEQNPSGGISVTGAMTTFHIVGNVFFKNGSTSTLFGGVTLSSVQTDNTLDFNTFAGNTAGGGNAAGVHCQVSLVASNNVIAYNTGTGSTPQADGSTGCTYSFTMSFPGTALTGTNNMATDPLFNNVGTGDLHVVSASPAVMAANPAANLMGLAADDPDGTPRHAPASVGAFQFH